MTTNNKPFKLNLGALNNSPNIKTNLENNFTEPKISEENIIIDKKINLTNHIEEKIKSIKLDLSKMKDKKEINSNKKKELLIKKEKEINNNKTINKKENIEVFSNYESDFNKKSETILQKIKQFKNFVKPKTRIGFLLRIIGLTSFGIASLFILMPEKHNLSNYKANLIIIKQEIICKIDKSKCIKKEIFQKNNKTLKKEIFQINSKTLKKEIFVIEYKSQIINGKEVIIYKGLKYTNEQFNKKIKEIIKRKKIEKLKDFLLKNKK